jgi:hypothetical protein
MDLISKKWIFNTPEEMIAAGLGGKSKCRKMLFNLSSLDDIPTIVPNINSVML